MSAVLKAVPKAPKRTIYRDVEVEFDLDEFDDEDLIAELESRNVHPPTVSVSIQEIYDALAARNEPRALELMRTYVMDHTGRILP